MLMRHRSSPASEFCDAFTLPLNTDARALKMPHQYRAYLRAKSDTWRTLFRIWNANLSDRRCLSGTNSKDVKKVLLSSANATYADFVEFRTLKLSFRHENQHVHAFTSNDDDDGQIAPGQDALPESEFR